MKKRILLIDDSPFFLKLLSDLLDNEFHVETASSGQSAIDLLEAIEGDAPDRPHPFDLLITDLEMPGLNGFDVARYVKEKNRRNKFLPIIMLTEQDITKEQARKHGCAAYVPKTNLNKVVSMTKIMLAR